MAMMFKAIGDGKLSEKTSNLVQAHESIAIVEIRETSGISRMKAIVKEALAQDDGIDLGPLSHEERLNLLLNR